MPLEPIPPITRDTSLPQSWRAVRLDSVYTFTKKPRGLDLQSYSEIPFVPMEMVPIGIEYFDHYVLRSAHEISSGTYFEPGDILLSKITPSFENGKQGIIEKLPTPFGYATTEVIPIKAIPGRSDQLFLFYYLLRHSVRNDLAGKMEGTTGRQRLNKSALESLEIPLPPLAEQRAIASTLHAAQAAVQVRRRAIELERERKAALMQTLFTRGTRSATATRTTLFGEVPQDWPDSPLDQCAFVQTGVAKGRDLKGKPTVELQYLRVANVQDGHLDLAKMKTIKLLASEVDRYKLQYGDVVVTEGGDFDKLGRGFIWHDEVPNCVHQNHIFAIRPDTEKLYSEFLAYLIQSSYGKAYFLSVAHRTTNLASINSTKLKALPVLLPPLSEQREIAEALRMCDEVIAKLEREATLLEELFRTLLEELMTGRVRVLVDEL